MVRSTSDRKIWYREWKLKSKYGISQNEYLKLLERQHGVCDICGNLNEHGRPLSIDHSHETGMIRGLLCDRCNRALGAFKDNPTLLQTAADYLIKNMIKED